MIVIKLPTKTAAFSVLIFRQAGKQHRIPKQCKLDPKTNKKANKQTNVFLQTEGLTTRQMTKDKRSLHFFVDYDQKAVLPATKGTCIKPDNQ